MRIRRLALCVLLLLVQTSIVYAASVGIARVGELPSSTSPPSSIGYPNFDLTFLKYPTYLILLPFIDQTFSVNIAIHNKGDFGAEVTLTYSILSDGKVVSKQIESLFLNAKESRQLSPSLLLPKETGSYTINVAITEPAQVKSIATTSIQVYSVVDWLLGPALFLTFIIIAVIIVILAYVGVREDWFDFL